MELRVGRGASDERLAAMERPFSEKRAREVKKGEGKIQMQVCYYYRREQWNFNNQWS